MEEGGDSTLGVERRLSWSRPVEQLLQPVAEVLLAKVGHALNDRVPFLNELLLADRFVPVQVQLAKERLDPCIGAVDVKRKMVVEDVNKLKLALRDGRLLLFVRLV